MQNQDDFISSEIDLTPNHRICFQGDLDSNGTGNGKITRFNLSNGLEERSVEGWLQEGEGEEDQAGEGEEAQTGEGEEAQAGGGEVEGEHSP